MTAGAVVGAGVEWAFNANWSAKVEYLHVWLSDSPSFSTQNEVTNNPQRPLAVFQRLNQTISQSNLDIVRVGVNYHFAGPVETWLPIATSVHYFLLKPRPIEPSDEQAG